MTNNTPTANSHWWVLDDKPNAQPEIVRVLDVINGTALIQYMGYFGDHAVRLSRFQWIGPVPMPGEFIPIRLAERLYVEVGKIADLCRYTGDDVPDDLRKDESISDELYGYLLARWTP